MWLRTRDSFSIIMMLDANNVDARLNGVIYCVHAIIACQPFENKIEIVIVSLTRRNEHLASVWRLNKVELIGISAKCFATRASRKAPIKYVLLESAVIEKQINYTKKFLHKYFNYLYLTSNCLTGFDVAHSAFR